MSIAKKMLAAGAAFCLLCGAAFAQKISASDLPDGFAGVGFKQNLTEPVTVSSRDELLEALQKGGVIYVSGMIDMSNGMLLSEAGGTNSVLDTFVKRNSGRKFPDYKTFMDSYAAACNISTDDTSSGSPRSAMYEAVTSLNKAYFGIVRLEIKSGTTIIGLDENSGFRGASIRIRNVQNVVLRNLMILDAFDPFPHHENGDGFNAELDSVSIQDSDNVWIDHCTLGDTIGVTKVRTGDSIEEKWQNFDGLCDITHTSDNITISWCKFMNHDKTMLIGSSDSEGIEPKNRKVTLHHNYFYNCGQRLPMTRLSQVHAYNNFYSFDSKAVYKSNYAVGTRYNAQINFEGNYIDSGISYLYSGSSSKPGFVYGKDNTDKSKNGPKSGQYKDSKEPLFAVPYKYKLDKTKSVPDIVKKGAGAGLVKVKK